MSRGATRPPVPRTAVQAPESEVRMPRLAHTLWISRASWAMASRVGMSVLLDGEADVRESLAGGFPAFRFASPGMTAFRVGF